MLPLRQRAAGLARGARLSPALPVSRVSRAFASTDSHAHDHSDHHDSHDSHDHHDHHKSHGPVDEPMGKGFFLALGAIPLSMAVYHLSHSAKEGETTALESYFHNFNYLTEQWETRNTLRTAAIEQAAHDKNLMFNVARNSHVDLRFPEGFQSGAPYNVPAGHSVNLDNVVAHYKNEYYKEADRQAKAAAKE